MLRALLVAGLVALPAAAQIPPPPTRAADCAAGDRLIHGLVPAATPAAEATLIDGWCRLDGFDDGAGGGMVALHIARIAWQAPGLAQAVDGGPAPEWLAVRLGGITRRYRTGDARIDYQFGVQANVPGTAIDAELALRLAPAQGLLVLERVRVAPPGGNRVALSAEAVAAPWNPAAPWAEAAERLEASRLARLDLTLDMRGLFEFYILPALLDRIGDPDDPAAAFEGLRADLTAALATAAGLSPETRDAATRLLGDLPHPQGRLTMSLRAVPGIDGAALLALVPTRLDATLAALRPLLDGVEVTLTYTAP